MAEETETPENLDEEAEIIKILEDALGSGLGFDQGIIDEFRSSEMFDDFLKTMSGNANTETSQIDYDGRDKGEPSRNSVSCDSRDLGETSPPKSEDPTVTLTSISSQFTSNSFRNNVKNPKMDARNAIISSAILRKITTVSLVGLEQMTSIFPSGIPSPLRNITAELLSNICQCEEQIKSLSLARWARSLNSNTTTTHSNQIFNLPSHESGVTSLHSKKKKVPNSKRALIADKKNTTKREKQSSDRLPHKKPWRNALTPDFIEPASSRKTVSPTEASDSSTIEAREDFDDTLGSDTSCEDPDLTAANIQSDNQQAAEVEHFASPSTPAINADKSKATTDADNIRICQGSQEQEDSADSLQRQIPSTPNPADLEGCTAGEGDLQSHETGESEKEKDENHSLISILPDNAAETSVKTFDQQQQAPPGELESPLPITPIPTPSAATADATEQEESPDVVLEHEHVEQLSPLEEKEKEYDNDKLHAKSSEKLKKHTKSPSPGRMIKKKKIIESSSDDDVRRDSETTPERKLSSDEEQVRDKQALPFERKREHSDSQPRKFAQLEYERMRKNEKLHEKKKGTDKQRESETIDEIFKEKPFTGSFRIPKKSTSGRKSHCRTQGAGTPLAYEDIPKENLQFERFRKGADKEKGRYEPDYFYREKSSNHYEEGQRKRINKESAGCFETRFREQERMVLLAPEENDANAQSVPSPNGEPVIEPEPALVQFGDERESASDKSQGLGQNPSSDFVEHDSKEIKSQSDLEEVDPDVDPEVPWEEIKVTAYAEEVARTLKENEAGNTGPKYPNLDDVEADNINNHLGHFLVDKIVWWYSKEMVEHESCSDSEQSVLDDEPVREEPADYWFDGFELDYFRSQPKRPQNSGELEYSGQALLTAKYRSGELFKDIFYLRAGATYDKHNFQANCTLCNTFVIGKSQLAAHIESERHRRKMSTLGQDPKSIEDDISISKNDHSSKSKKVARDNGEKYGDKEKSEVRSDTHEKKEKQVSESTTDQKDDKRKGDDKTEKDRNTDKDKGKKPQDRSEKDIPGDQVNSITGVTTSGPRIKIPVSAIPVRKPSVSRERKSRSRSPQRDKRKSRSRSPHRNYKRNRSRSPRRSRSPSSRRRRNRSRTPIQRILRSPTRAHEHRRRSRSKSEERVKKFLSRTKSRRSRSPSRSRKYSRRSRSRSPSGTSVLPKRGNREFHEKLALTAEGLWNPELEQRWKLMEAEEAIFNEQFGEKSKSLLEVPEKHSRYSAEWENFWERRYKELEDMGMNPEKHDFVPEWKDFWTKRLRELLEQEYDMEINKVKKKSGMDFESLQKIRFAHKKSAEKLVKTPVPVPEPPVLTANAAEVTMTPPAASVSNVPSASNSFGGSISGESNSFIVDVANPVKSTEPTAAVTTKEVMSTWAKYTSGGVSLPTQSTSGIQSKLSTTSLPSIAKSVGSIKSNASLPESIASIDFKGFSLVEVLHSISSLEDQLSFFAPKVKEYYKLAEEHELKKHNKSQELLDDEDFVIMLVQIRDKFKRMVGANVVPDQQILRSLNVSVYGLDALLEAPQCQQHLSKNPETPVPPPPVESSADTKNQQDEEKTDDDRIDRGSPIITHWDEDQYNYPVATFSSSTQESLIASAKHEISHLITDFLLNHGLENISNEELSNLCARLMTQRKPKAVTQSKRSPVPENSEMNVGRGNTDGTKGQEAPSSSSQRQDHASIPDPWSLPLPSPKVSRLFSIASVTGSSRFPSLPTISSEALQDPTCGQATREHPWGILGDKDGNKSSSSDSGRRSPFSRRDFTGNSGCNPFRDQDRQIQNEHHYTNDRHVSISAIDDVTSTGGRNKRQREITIGQLIQPVSTKKLHAAASNASRYKPPLNRENEDEISRFPPGIRNMIMTERERKQRSENVKVHLSSNEDRLHTHHDIQERRSKRARKRKKRRDRSSSSDSSDDEYHYCQREKDRRKRRQRKEIQRRNHSSVYLYSDSSLESFEDTACPSRIYENLEESSLIRERNLGMKYHDPRPKDSALRYGTPLSDTSSKINVTPASVSYKKSHLGWDEISDVSSVQEARINLKENATSLAYSDTKLQTVNPPKDAVVSVSKTFWTMRDDEKSICSISSTEVKEIEKPEEKAVSQRKYRVSDDEKEPGELSSDN